MADVHVLKNWHILQLHKHLLWLFVSTCRYGFTFLGLKGKTMKILNRNNDVEK